MEVLGHRGSRVPGPENTVAALDAALAAGADGVEVDVRRSADGELVCVHDARLPRLATRTPQTGSADQVGTPGHAFGPLGGRAVLRSTARELAARGVPRLDEIVDAWAGRGRLIIEIKNQPGQPDFDAPRERSARLLLDLLRARGLAGPAARSRLGQPGTVTVSSFDWHAIEVIRDADIGVGTAFLLMPRMSVGAGLTYVRMAGHAELHAHVSAVSGSGDAVGRARQAGIRLVAWTVTATDAALRLHEAGVDGVICDDPAEVVRAVRDADSAHHA